MAKEKKKSPFEAFEYKSPKDLKVKLLGKIKYYEQALEALEFATNSVQNGFVDGAKAPELRAAIFEQLHRAHSDLFMFGNLFGGDLQKKATKLAQEQFLHERMALYSNHYVQEHSDYHRYRIVVAD